MAYACILGMAVLGPVLFSAETKPVSGLDYLNEAMAAYQKKMYPAYLENLEKAYRLLPGYAALKYYLASAHALNGHREEAIQWLKKVADLGMSFPAAGEPDFDTLKDSASFKAVLEKFAANQVPIKNSKIAFTVPEKDLVPEGITYNPKNETFYITSIYKRKIIAVNRAGQAVDFIAPGQDNFWGGVGITVDVARQVLWANNRVGNHMMGYQKEKPGLAGISKYDIATRKLIKKYVLPGDVPHLLNDIAVQAGGDVFVTDSETGAVYTVPAQKDELELFIEPGRLLYANGITISEEGEFLFAADLEGITRIHIRSKEMQKLSPPGNLLVNGIDGLYFYRGSLVAVQNDSGLNRVTRIFLNKTLDKIENLTVLEANHPLYNIPTTGVCVGGEFYYIANSQMNNFDGDNRIFPRERMKEVVILKISLL